VGDFGPALSYQPRQFASANRRFQFQKRSQLFIRVHNETLSIIALCTNEDSRSLESAAANACGLIAKAAPTVAY
jgi:hypothetical protein